MEEKGRPNHDVEDVIREEVSRGRRPVDTDALRERQELRARCRELLQYGTEQDVREAMLALGLKDGSPQFLEALRIWRSYRRP